MFSYSFFSSLRFVLCVLVRSFFFVSVAVIVVVCSLYTCSRQFFFRFFRILCSSFLNKFLVLFIVYTHTNTNVQNKWFESVFFVSFTLPFVLPQSISFESMCKPLYRIVNAFVHSKQHYWWAAYSQHTHLHTYRVQQRWQATSVRIDYKRT